MKDKNIILIQKIIEYGTQVDEAVELFKNDFNVFKTSSVFRNSCCMCILQIGELCKLISVDLKDSYSEVPWRQWCGIRDIFAHQYSNMDYDIAWGVIQDDLPSLIGTAKLILKNLTIEDVSLEEDLEKTSTMGDTIKQLSIDEDVKKMK